MQNKVSVAKSDGRMRAAIHLHRYEKAIAGSYRKSRHAIARLSPSWVRRLFSPALEYFDLFAVDHGIFRAVYSNTHRVTQDLWRSSQPAPYQIRRLARKGIRTIINLRGARDCGSYRLEVAACARHGIKLIDFPFLRSRAAPSKESIHHAKQVFENIEYPALVHCKTGADRAGLASSLYLLLREGLPIEDAIGQLGFRYGHIKQARTGILDCFFECYMERNEEVPTPFLTWLETAYDPEELIRSFQPQSWANILADGILRRE